MNETQTRKRFTGRMRVLPLALIGAGLVLLGVLAWVLLPRLGVGAVQRAGQGFV